MSIGSLSTRNICDKWFKMCTDDVSKCWSLKELAHISRMGPRKSYMAALINFFHNNYVR